LPLIYKSKKASKHRIEFYEFFEEK